jgi:hypothetical protein
LVALALDGRGVYGRWEGNGVAPTDLDACGGHFGSVPSFSEGDDYYPAATNVYHYHLQDVAPYTLGCYGPVDNLDACKTLYDTCDGETLSIETLDGILMYDDDCTCYRDQHGAIYNPTPEASPTTTTIFDDSSNTDIVDSTTTTTNDNNNNDLSTTSSSSSTDATTETTDSIYFTEVHFPVPPSSISIANHFSISIKVLFVILIALILM